MKLLTGNISIVGVSTCLQFYAYSTMTHSADVVALELLLLLHMFLLLVNDLILACHLHLFDLVSSKLSCALSVPRTVVLQDKARGVLEHALRLHLSMDFLQLVDSRLI